MLYHLATKTVILLMCCACSLSALALNYSGRQHNSASFETLAEARKNAPLAVANLEGNRGRTFVSHPALDGYPDNSTWIYRSANLYGGRAAARINTNILVFAEASFPTKDQAFQYLENLGLINIIDQAVGSVILVTPADGKTFGGTDQKNYYALQTALFAQKAGEGGRDGPRYADAEYFGGFGYTYVIGLNGGATFINNYLVGTLDYVSRMAGVLLVNGSMQDISSVAGLVPIYLINASEKTVQKYRDANNTDAYEKAGQATTWFDQNLPHKRVIEVRDDNPELAKYIEDAYYNLFTHAMRVPVGRPGLHSASTPYQGYSMDQAPLSLTERNAIINGSTRDGIHLIERQENNFKKFATENGDFMQTWFEYLPTEVTKNNVPKGSVPLVLALHGGGDDPRQFVEEIGLLPLAGRERFAIVAPEHQSSIPTLAESLPALVEYMLKRWPALDPSRVYVTGYSLGGAATLRAVNGDPAIFAAAVPMAAAPYIGTEQQVKQFDKVDLPILFTTSEFDLPGAFDQSKGTIASSYQNQLNLFLSYNGMEKIESFDFDTYPVNGFNANWMQKTTLNGEYDSYLWYINNADDVPMVGVSYTKSLMHALYPEYGKIAWDFFKHYARDPKTKRIIYNAHVK